MPFDCYIRRAVENEKVIFPKMFCKTDIEAAESSKKNINLKSLEAEQRGMRDQYRFMCQFFNDPIDESTIEFKRNYIIRADLTGTLAKQLDQVQAIISVDPAIRLKETNDKTGIVVTKTLKDTRQIVIMEAIGKRINVDQMVEEIFRLVKSYNTERVLIETVAAQLWLVKILKDEMVKRGIFFSINEVNPSTRETKAARIRGLLPYYANNRILHREGLTQLESELIQFPRSKHDDIIDALSMQILYWKDILGGTRKTTFVKLTPFTVDWFKSKIPRHQSSNDMIFKGIIKRRSSI